MRSDLAPSEVVLARVMTPKIVWLVITNARLMELADDDSMVSLGWWADEIATTAVKDKFFASIKVTATDGEKFEIPIQRRDAALVSQALESMLSEPNLAARRELVDVRSKGSSEQPLDAYGNLELWPDRLFNRIVNKTYPLDSRTHAEAHVDTQVASPTANEVNSGQIVSLVVAHPEYSFAIKANPNDGAYIRAFAARINAIAATLAAGAPPVVAPGESVDALIDVLADSTRAVAPADFLAARGEGLHVAGLYSWWVDAAGAQDLSAGLGTPVEPGLVYVGKSVNLWSRLSKQHLGRNRKVSTLRRTLGPVIASATQSPSADEAELTAWMQAHLRLHAVPAGEPDTVAGLEKQVLAALDPPLNLDGMSPSAARSQLTTLRRATPWGQ